MPALKQLYLQQRKRSNKDVDVDDDFEIIYISLGCIESPTSFVASIQAMPWLVHPFAPYFGVKLAAKIFDSLKLPAIAAFGADGHLETKESNLGFKKKWDSKYPFIQPEMDDEVHSEILHKHNYKWVIKESWED